MATVGFTEAAKLAGVSRQHLYKLADAGQISVGKELLPGKTGDNPKDFRQTIDVSELQRVFGQLTAVDTTDQSTNTDANSGNGSKYALLEAELSAVRQLLRQREEELRKAEEREGWLRNQITESQSVVKLISHLKPLPGGQMIPLENHQKIIKIGQAQINRLVAELEYEKKRGFWSRLFR